MREKFSCRATGIGSLPLTSSEDACNLIIDNLEDIPFWPQLSNLSFLENMYAQFVYTIPGAVIDKDNKRVYFDTSSEPEDLEAFLNMLLKENIDSFAYSEEYFHGLFTLLNNKDRLNDIMMLKGQITGPISLGFQVSDENRKPIYYNDIYRDLMIKNLRMMARWQERTLRSICERTMIFLDEPYLSMIGSAFVSLSREKTIEHINEVLTGISGVSAIHCCANTDWSMVLQCNIDVLSFDAYGYSESLFLYPKQVIDFIEKGGTIAWGIVPTNDEELASESADSLVKRLEENMEILSEKGISMEKILAQSLITPSCGLGPASVPSAQRALPMLKEISKKMRDKHGLS
jgi:methionine synthase II (cobalamin-independent)